MMLSRTEKSEDKGLFCDIVRVYAYKYLKDEGEIQRKVAVSVTYEDSGTRNASLN